MSYDITLVNACFLNTVRHFYYSYKKNGTAEKVEEQLRILIKTGPDFKTKSGPKALSEYNVELQELKKRLSKKRVKEDKQYLIACLSGCQVCFTNSIIALGILQAGKAVVNNCTDQSWKNLRTKLHNFHIADIPYY